MKTLTLILSLIISSVAVAKEPAELVKLRKTWENSQAEAKKKAEEIYRSKNIKSNKLYHEELKQMKDNFMEAKNLDGANAVDAEIKKLIAQHGKQQRNPLDGAWQYTGKKYGWQRVLIFDGKKLIHYTGKVEEWTQKDDIIESSYGSFKVDPKNPDIMHDAKHGNFTVTRIKL